MSVAFRSLLDQDRGERRGVREIVADLAPQIAAAGQATAGRPYVMLNMASTADGRASIGGRSGPIGNRADTELFHALRTTVDGVMIGAQTLRTERYNRIVDDERERGARSRRGLAPEPLACVLTASLDLDPEIPLLADPGARVVIITASAGTLPAGCAAAIDYLRIGGEGALDIPAALERLRERFGTETLLCEGGPHVNGQLLADGLVDELFLSLAPKLAGGTSSGQTLRIVVGGELDPPVELELLWLLESEDELFLRYRVRAARS